MSSPRIAPGDLDDTGLLVWAFARVAGRVTGTNPPHVFTTLGRTRGLFWGWLHFAGRLMPGGKLPRRETELVILRVAHRRGSVYEFEHHARLGRRVGVTADDLDRVREHGVADGWSHHEAVLLRAVDELLETRDLGDGTWAELAAELDPRRAIELLLLV
ncbi:MAG: carboxymuconolactone decarboxylase family protein, partial [Nocardioidaceae bacterium]